MLTRISAALLAALACSNQPEPPVSTPVTAQAIEQPGTRIACKVSKIADGDTIYCGKTGRIRLLMIDAPELSQGRYGYDALDKLAAIMPVGTSVTIETDVRARDAYDRILGYIWLSDGRMVNEEMAKTGYVTALVYPPNVKYVDRIRNAVADARREKRGLYGTRFFDCSPRDYRAHRCG
jgi:micrococcal nuclease